MEQEGFNEMERPDLEAAAKGDEEVDRLKETAYGINEAENLEDLSDAVYKGGDEDMIKAFHAELFDQMKKVDPDTMKQYSGYNEEGYLLVDGQESSHITQQGEDVFTAAPESLRLDELKFEVQRVGDHPADQEAA